MVAHGRCALYLNWLLQRLHVCDLTHTLVVCLLAAGCCVQLNISLFAFNLLVPAYPLVSTCTMESQKLLSLEYCSSTPAPGWRGHITARLCLPNKFPSLRKYRMVKNQDNHHVAFPCRSMYGGALNMTATCMCARTHQQGT